MTIQPNPVKTSTKFNLNTADNNQYYISICLIITHLICCNPLGLVCACIGFYFAQKVMYMADEQKITIGHDIIISSYSLRNMQKV